MKENIFQYKKDNIGIIEKIFSESTKVSYSTLINIALYDNDYGYYKKNKRALHRDFITSPLTHESFGFLIADQIKEIWEYFNKTDNFTIIELGGSYGKLRSDITTRIKSAYPILFDSLNYIIIDEVYDDDLLSMKQINSVGCIISNEFFDSLPFNRYEKVNNDINEILIERNNDLSIQEVIDTSSKKLALSKKSLKQIPSGSRIELIDNLGTISEKIASLLEECVLLTIDYGFESLDSLYINNPNGLVRCYKNHNMDKEILNDIGSKDITCDVNFPVLNMHLNNAGFKLIGNTTQDKFLYRMNIRKMFDTLKNPQDRQQIISLMNPESFGGFKVYFHQLNIKNYEPRGLA